MTPVEQRSKVILNLKQYNNSNLMDKVCSVNFKIPTEKQYILRMLIKQPFEKYKIPNELEWAREFISLCNLHQETKIKIKHPYCYITIRNGFVESENDDVWHVDGFSTRFSHLPEQNYIWTNCYPTKVLIQPFDFPKDFDPDKHNIHLYFQEKANDDFSFELKTKTIYCLDPYIIHKRPTIPKNIWRTFIRVSFTPIPIMDINNTVNPLIPIEWKRDGVEEFRNQLIRYKEILK